MAFLLMWIEALAAALLFVAMIMSLRRRSTKHWQLVACGAIIGLVLLTPIALVFAFAFKSRLQQFLGAGLMVSLLCWAAVFAAGAAVIVVRGARRTESDPPFRAGTWPRAKLGIAFGAALALLLITFWNTDAAVRVQLAALRAEAGALALSVAPPRVPDRDNAAIFYEKAFEAMVPAKDMPAEWTAKQSKWQSGFSRPNFDTADKDFRDYLARHRAALDYFRRGSALPGCHFERDYGQPSMDMPLPELGRMRAGARLLAASARVRAADADVKGALEDVTAIFNLSAHTGQEPLLISLLVAAAINNLGKDSLEGVLAGATAAAAELSVLKLADNRSFQHLLRRALIYEEASGLSAFATLATPEGVQSMRYMYTSGQLEAGLFDSLVLPPWRVFLLPDDLAAYRGSMRECRHLNLRPYYETKAEWQKYESIAEAKPGGILTSLIMPALSRTSFATHRADAVHRLSCLAVAAATYRAKNLRFPEKLEDLAPDFITAIPTDPFDGKPLKMERSGQGLVLYSVGPDGKPLPEKPFTEDDWRVFRLGATAPDGKKADF